jgi:hypothetical protein
MVIAPPSGGSERDTAMGLISLLWGIVALLWMLLAFIPLLG